jgi:O-antigen/teichoic acid export membrane protein
VNGRLLWLARGTLIYGVGQALSRSLSLLLLPVLTAYLDPAAYGILAVLTALGLVLHAVFSLGLGAATAPSYFERGSPDQKAATIWTAFAILCVSSGVMLALAAVFSTQIAGVVLLDGGSGYLVRLTAAATAFSILAVPFRQVLMFEEQPGRYVRLSLASVGGAIVLTIWTVVGLGRGLAGVLEAELIGQGLTFVLFAIPVFRTSTFQVRRKLVSELVRLGLPLIPAFAAVFVLLHGSRYVLQWLRGPDDVGIYAVGVTLAAVVGLFVAGFQSAWLPYFMSYIDRPDEARVAFGRVATYYVFGVGSVSLLLCIMAKATVFLLAAPEYRGAELVVGLAATTQFLSGLFLVLMPGVYFAREVQYLGMLQAFAAGLAVALNVLLVPPFGFVGSAVAVLTSYAVLVVLQYLWNQQRGYVQVVYEWYRLRRFGLLYLSVALLSFTQRDWGIVGELALSAGGGGILAGALWWLLTPEEREIARAKLSRRISGFTGEAPAGLR